MKRNTTKSKDLTGEADEVYALIKKGKKLVYQGGRKWAFEEGRIVDAPVIALLRQQKRAKLEGEGRYPRLVPSSSAEYEAEERKRQDEGKQRRRARLDRWKDLIERAMSDDRLFVRDLLDDALEKIADEAACLSSLED